MMTAPEAAWRTARLTAATVPRRLASRIGQLGGWRRAVLALLLGLLAAPAMPPWNLVPLLVPSFTGLVWLLDGAATRRRGFYDGWLWGMGFFVPNIYWVAAAMFVDLAQFWWMVPVCVLGLPAAMSLFPGAGMALYRSLRGTGLGRIWLFAICWVLAEWLRGHIPFGGFPWVLIGYAWSSDAAIALDIVQSTSLFGIYGLSFFTVLVAALPAGLGDSPGPHQSRLRPFCGIAIGTALLLAAVIWGDFRLAHGVTGTVRGVTLRIIQTDIADQASVDDQEAIDRLRRVFTLAGSRGAESVTAQIWPESSVELLLNQEPEIQAAIGRLAPTEGFVLTGTALGYWAAGKPYVHNSVAAIDHAGDIRASYDKAHLVPFGEYIPLRWLLDFIPAVGGRGGLSTGPGPATLHLPGLPPVAPIVCYEAVFSHGVIDEADRPGWLLNDTNDAWFGRSIGPEQHFALARIRAVEEGLPLIRAANGGISGVVDAYGRRVETLPLGMETALDSKLPVALAADTPYGNVGDAPLLLIVFLTLLPCIVSIWRRFHGRY
jgi:apolipoprotein N-acyltransferase